jgi:hypothetical protein
MAKWWLLDSSFLRFYEFLNNFTVQAKYLFIYTALEKKKKKPKNTWQRRRRWAEDSKLNLDQ